MKRQTAQLRRLNTQILEGLRLRINHLIDKLPLYLVRGDCMPPQNPVQSTSNGLQQPFGYIKVSPMLDDFAVHEVGDFGSRIVLRAVKLVGLRCSAVVLEHSF